MMNNGKCPSIPLNIVVYSKSCNKGKLPENIINMKPGLCIKHGDLVFASNMDKPPHSMLGSGQHKDFNFLYALYKEQR